MPSMIQKLRASGQWDSVHVVAVVTLAAALLIGGGGAAGPLNNGILASLGLFLLLTVFWAHFTDRRRLPNITIWPALLMLGVLALGLFQLTPVANAPWADTPGREIETALLALFGENVARPLSIDTAATKRALAGFLLPFGLLMAAMGSTKTQFRHFFVIIFAGLMIHAAWAIMQIALGYPEHLSIYDGRRVLEITGLFANPNHFGTFIALGILAIAAWNVLTSGKSRSRRRGNSASTKLKAKLNQPSILALVLCGPLIALLALLGSSRAGLILVTIAIPVALLAAFRPKSSKMVISFLLLAPIVLVIFDLLSPQIDLASIATRLWDPENIRLAILPDLLYVTESFWPWGVGLGGFDGAFRANENLDFLIPFYINHAHNDWIEWALETGIPGVALLGAFFLVTIGLVIKALRNASGEGSKLRHAMLVAAAAQLLTGLHSLIDYPVRMATINAVLAIFLALLWLPWLAARDQGEPASMKKRVGLGVVLLVIGLAMASQLVRLYAAQAAFLDRRAAAAVALDPNHGTALAAVAARATQERDSAQIIPVARKALIERPYSANAVRAIAIALELDGDPNNPAWPLAAALGWRDGPTQLWAFGQALEVGQFDIAALRADALMRTQDQPEDFEQVLWQLASIPEFREKLVERLNLDPFWRKRWLSAGPSQAGQAIDGSVALMDDLRASGTLSREEMRGSLRAMLQTERFADAQRLYESLPKTSSFEGLADDNGFEYQADLYKGKLTPFDWNLREGGGFLSQVEGSNDQNLYLETDGRGNYVLVDRTLSLAPGPHSVSLNVEDSDGDASAFSVAMVCVGEEDRLMLERLDDGANTIEFTIPPACPAQVFLILGRISDRYSGISVDDVVFRRNDG